MPGLTILRHGRAYETEPERSRRSSEPSGMLREQAAGLVGHKALKEIQDVALKRPNLQVLQQFRQALRVLPS